MFKHVTITSGPTIEPLDPIRFLSNRSSGKTGYYLAHEAKTRNIEKIIYLTGPTFYIPSGVDLIQIETAMELREQVLEHFPQTEVLIMAAAVCDYRSLKYYPEKIKKDKEHLTLEFVRNPDILQEIVRQKKKNQLVIGFAAETDNIFENATKKLKSKNLDLLVLNEISESNPAFDAEENQVFLVTPNQMKKLEKMKKAKLAARIWDEIEAIASAK